MHCGKGYAQEENLTYYLIYQSEREPFLVHPLITNYSFFWTPQKSVSSNIGTPAYSHPSSPPYTMASLLKNICFNTPCEPLFSSLWMRGQIYEHPVQPSVTTPLQKWDHKSSLLCMLMHITQKQHENSTKDVTNNKSSWGQSVTGPPSITSGEHANCLILIPLG